MWFKNLTTPASNETKTVEAVQLWEVRWTSRHGEYSGDTRPEMECFRSFDLAADFKIALENAFRLIRTTSGDRVVIQKGAQV